MGKMSKKTNEDLTSREVQSPIEAPRRCGVGTWGLIAITIAVLSLGSLFPASHDAVPKCVDHTIIGSCTYFDAECHGDIADMDSVTCRSSRCVCRPGYCARDSHHCVKED